MILLNMNDSSNELDPLTKYRMLGDKVQDIHLVDRITALAFVIGILVGIIIASFLHKYIAHPLGF